MNTPPKTAPRLSIFNKAQILFFLIFALHQFTHLFASTPFAIKPAAKCVIYSADTLRTVVKKLRKTLNFPETVDRFYKQRDYAFAWVLANEASNTWNAMMLLDCTKQYGLNRNNYHPDKLVYQTLHSMIEQPLNSTAYDKAVMDVYLTDAILSVINHLHYGNLNPYFSPAKIDADKAGAMKANEVLSAALKSEDLTTALLLVQPANERYKALQGYMRLVRGQYTADCYEVPQEDVLLAAINMERLRWMPERTAEAVYINIPAYTLKLYNNDLYDDFKLVVGKAETPTPTLYSVITHFTTMPEWKIPQKIFNREILPKALADSNYLAKNGYYIYYDKGGIVDPDKVKPADVQLDPDKYSLRQIPGKNNALGRVIFRFSNKYAVYLHDTPEQRLFSKETRAFSHGCVRVENALVLAKLLLGADQNAAKITDLEAALLKNQTKSFYLTKPVQIIITYLTVEVVDSKLVPYKDIYKLDKPLAKALFGNYQP